MDGFQRVANRPLATPQERLQNDKNARTKLLGSA